MNSILIVEDDNTFAKILEVFLVKNGFSVTTKNSVKSAIEALNAQKFDILLLDYRLGDGIGMDIIDYNLENSQFIPSVIMTSFNDVRTAVKAIQKGVFDYITKPVNPEELLMILQEAQKKPFQPVLTPSAEEEEGLRNTVKSETSLDKKTLSLNSDKKFVDGKSKQAQKLYEYVQLVAPTDMSVLIRGESGTGKEHIARSIHQHSKRALKPFVSIDCGTLSKELASSELFGHVKGSFTGALQDKVGQFLEASGGTLFLDEIGNLSYDVQVKLLRALQEKVIQPVGGNKLIEVDVRILAATNEDLISNFSEGKFREDLYHRINEFEIVVPPLRERTADFDEFLLFFIDQSNKELERNVEKLDDKTYEVLRSYDWPGNLRELKNIVKRMVLLTKGTVAKVEALPEDMLKNLIRNELNSAEPLSLSKEMMDENLKSQSEAHERNLIIDALVKTKYNKSKAAQLLQIDRKTLYNKIEKYGI